MSFRRNRSTDRSGEWEYFCGSSWKRVGGNLRKDGCNPYYPPLAKGDEGGF